MSIELSSPKKKLVDEIASRENFHDYTIDVQTGSVKGDGYLGIIETVDITEKTSKKSLHLIMKSASASQKFRENTPVTKAYEREVFMYEKVFPAYQKLAAQKSTATRFTEYPKCYGTLLQNLEECLVLENLREAGFKMWDRFVPMDGPHVEAIFRIYGKLHGYGMALKYLETPVFKELKGNMENIFEGFGDEEKMMDSFKAVFANGFKSVAGNEKATAALLKFTQESTGFFKVELKQENKTFCFLHGDCWCNNMMFKYADLKHPDKPSEAVLLDFQISQYGSPIVDLSYFFYATSSKQCLEDLDKFLQIYHESLSTVLKETGLEPDKIMSFEDLQEQWRQFSKFGLFMTLFVMNVVLSKSEDSIDLSELAESGKDIVQSIVGMGSEGVEALGLQRIANVITFMTDRNFI